MLKQLLHSENNISYKHYTPVKRNILFSKSVQNMFYILYAFSCLGISLKTFYTVYTNNVYEYIHPSSLQVSFLHARLRSKVRKSPPGHVDDITISKL